MKHILLAISTLMLLAAYALATEAPQQRGSVPTIMSMLQLRTIEPSPLFTPVQTNPTCRNGHGACGGSSGTLQCNSKQRPCYNPGVTTCETFYGADACP